MDIYASDDEKAEIIKQWWRKNGLTVLVLIMITVGALIIGRYWYAEKERQSGQAAQLYYAVETPITSENLSKATTYIDMLMAEYADTPYAFFLVIQLAQYHALMSEYDRAQEYLIWAKERAMFPGQTDLIHLKMAKLAIAKGNNDDALRILKERKTNSFEGLFKELEGDIYLQKVDLIMAREAYDIAYEKSEADRKVIIKLKRDDVVGP